MVKATELIEKVISGVRYSCQDNNDEGHMGIVCYGENSTHGNVAIKQLKQNLKNTHLETIFLESGNAMASLSNKGLDYLVKTFDSVKESTTGESYIVMEAMESNLANVIDGFIEKKKLSKKDLALAYTYTYNLFNALDELHQQEYNGKKVTHNDFLPTNVLISGKRLKLTDLLVIPSGIDSEEAQEIMDRSSIAYLAQTGEEKPNMRYLVYLSGEDPSIERDVYMAGLMATELLTGKSARKIKSKPIDKTTRFTGKSKLIPEKASIIEIIQKTTRSLADERPSTSEVIKAFKNAFKPGDAKFSEECFCLLEIESNSNYEIISRPADRFKQLIDMSAKDSDNAIKDLHDLVSNLKVFGEITGVHPEEKKEMANDLIRYQTVIKDSVIGDKEKLESKIKSIDEKIAYKKNEIESEKSKWDKRTMVGKEEIDEESIADFNDFKEERKRGYDSELKVFVSDGERSKNVTKIRIAELKKTIDALSMSPEELMTQLS